LAFNLFGRYKIVKDIGRALRYFHHECDPYILHRDIKPCNILLDKAFNAKLADFGLSRIANEDNETLRITAEGTVGYMDPQCMGNGKVRFNRRSDVYSFGIVLLEIACTNLTREQVCDLYTRGAAGAMEAADARLNGEFDRMQMERVVVLGLSCSCPVGAQRSTMEEAMDVLEHDAPLPDLNRFYQG
jgi:serine/threonine protein kinase